MKILFTAQPADAPLMKCLESESEYIFNGGESEHTLLKSATSYERLINHWQGYCENNGAPYAELIASSCVSIASIRRSNPAANIQRMTASDVKYQVERTGSHYFERSSMKFFGDKMSNYYVPVNTVEIVTSSGDSHICYELQRRKPVKHGLSDSTYFDAFTFKRVLEAK